MAFSLILVAGENNEDFALLPFNKWVMQQKYCGPSNIFPMIWKYGPIDN